MIYKIKLLPGALLKTMAKNTTVYYHLHQDVKVQEKRKKKKCFIKYKILWMFLSSFREVDF